jgi:hypothetical protein
MFLTRTVPAAVPSLFHNSRPVSGWKAEKKRVPFTSVNSSGFDSPSIQRSCTRFVPAAVPSLLKSSRPEVPSSETKKRLLPDTVKP